MEKRMITETLLVSFEESLYNDEKSKATIEKYRRDIRKFVMYSNGREIDKPLILAYKSELEKQYAVASANSMLAAINTLFRFAGWYDLCVKQFKVQKAVYCPEEKELTKKEYEALIKTAEEKQNERLSLVIQTICGTGIRVSELQYITVEAIQKGEAIVSCKGKTRKIFIVSALRKKLLRYANEQGIKSGMYLLQNRGKQ